MLRASIASSLVALVALSITACDKDKASSTTTDGAKTLLNGLAVGASVLASLVFFMAMTALSLFFLLKDGPTIRAWTERHMGLPSSVASMITRRTLQALRGYFAGVTAVAVFNAVVIGLGAIVLSVPQAGSIALVNFFAAYITYLRAWTAGAFTVLIALGSQGTETAIAMAVIVLLANGLLQQAISSIDEVQQNVNAAIQAAEGVQARL